MNYNIELNMDELVDVIAILELRAAKCEEDAAAWSDECCELAEDFKESAIKYKALAQKFREAWQ